MLKRMQLIFILLISKIILNASMVGSKHDLSITNFYGVDSAASTQICVFCHTPHASSTTIEGPLWNRNITDDSTYVLYSGASGLPNNPSLVCLSCHDGISASGELSAVDAGDTHNVINSPGPGHDTDPASPNCNACHFSGGMYPDATWTVGPDLTDDHPVSISYEAARLASPDFFEMIPKNGLKLYDGNVECSSCHDPHETVNTAFLRLSNSASALCTSCHIK